MYLERGGVGLADVGGEAIGIAIDNISFFKALETRRYYDDLGNFFMAWVFAKCHDFKIHSIKKSDAYQKWVGPFLDKLRTKIYKMYSGSNKFTMKEKIGPI